jgi:Cd2+/Zn2+-exporting ATPase
MGPKPEQLSAGRWWRYPILRNALLSGGIAALGFVLAHLGIISAAAERSFYLIAIPLGGYHWAREALEELVREHEVGIDLLMLAAAAGSCVLGLWDEAAFLVFLYGAAEGLEEYTYARTRSAIRALLDLAPKEAHVLRDGRELTIPAEQLRPGDRFLVRPGEALPTDGVIRAGTSSLDESPVTGESVPVDKGPGMKVFAATLNRQGALEIEATAGFQDNTLAKIIHLVEDAQEQKGKAQQWIERFGRWYSPAVLGVSVLLLAVPYLAGLSLATWSVRAVVLLVAAAPCALVMSMPVAMAAGITAAGKHGILIKGGAHLEQLGAIAAVAFDKTGTLTQGEPSLVDVITFVGSPGELLALAAGIERFSEHPLARAIVQRAARDGFTPTDVTDFTALTGAGAKATIGESTYYVGNPDLFQRFGADLAPAAAQIAALQEQGKTVVVVGNDNRELRGLLAIEDRVRPEAREIVAALHAAKVHVVMLTGDNERTARAVARTVGIDDVRSNLTPEGKVLAVGDIERRHGAVLMVGDGVNDAPALAAATCGVAMGVAGSDAAIEAADVALMADDLDKVREALGIGRRARNISRQNIIFSILVLVVLVPTAVLGTLSVAAAVLAHELSELLAVANGLRVRTTKRYQR